MTQEGQVLKSFTVEKDNPDDFIAACVSPRGEFIYALSSDKKLYCFNIERSGLEDHVEVTDKGPIGLIHHPSQNLTATYSEDGLLKLWCP